MTANSTDSEKTGSLWEHNAIPCPQTQSLNADIDVDTIIVGAGFTGLRAALHLAQSGQKVAVVETNTIGWGASGRNGGQVNPLPPENTPETMEKSLGPKFKDRVVEAMLGSADELFELIEKYSINCQARQKGWLRVDHYPGARKNARQAARAWGEYGIDVEYLEGERLHVETGSKAFDSGTLIKKGGAIHPLSYARGLAQCAIDSGAQIFTHSPALSNVKKGARWVVSTPGGSVSAKTVLACTNGYSDNLIWGLSRSIIPLVSIQMATTRLDESLISSILPNGRTLSDTRRTIVYGRKEPDNRILLGSLGRLSERGDMAAFSELKTEAVRLYPSLAHASWEFHWSGQIAITDDHLPHLHEPEPGIFAGLGYNGRGVAMSNVMGRVLAQRGARPDGRRNRVSNHSNQTLPATPILQDGCPGGYVVDANKGQSGNIRKLNVAGLFAGNGFKTDLFFIFVLKVTTDQFGYML